MQAHQLTPILNVSDLAASFDWFAKLGWPKGWEWCPPGERPSFGAVTSGGIEIHLCLNGQGGRVFFGVTDAGKIRGQTISEQPRSRSFSTTNEPRNPAPPVTTTRLLVQKLILESALFGGAPLDG